jgi:phage shock protein PspC (stress-responsive transcriptional regulator)
MSQRRLVRSTTDRKVSGVAGGIADHLRIDSTVVRLIWVLVIVLPGGFGLIPYLILWIVLPQGDTRALSSPAIAIAEERYARGEIDAAELARMKQDLAR